MSRISQMHVTKTFTESVLTTYKNVLKKKRILKMHVIHLYRKRVAKLAGTVQNMKPVQIAQVSYFLHFAVVTCMLEGVNFIHRKVFLLLQEGFSAATLFCYTGIHHRYCAKWGVTIILLVGRRENKLEI